MYENKLSVVIPTKNRQSFAAKCIQTILEFLHGNYEIVVHDNSDDDSLRGMLGDAVDGVRLKYAYVSECLSFCDNFEKSIEMSCGDYVIIIGDDDCVLPEIVALTDSVRAKNIDSVVFSTAHTYIWPNAVAVSGGKLVLRQSRHGMKLVSTATALREMMEAGNFDYQRYAFPKIYHGLIKRKKLDEVKKRTGRYFGGLTPDIYSAVSLAFYIERILYINAPFTLPGTCPKSGSADSLTGRHTGELSSAPHFRGHTAYEWDAEIPYVYSVDTIWAETAFKAVKENGLGIAFTDSQCFAFLTHICLRCPMFRDRLAKFYAERTGGQVDRIASRLDRAAALLKRKYWIRKAFSFGLQLLKGRHAFYDVQDISAAMKILCDKNKKYSGLFKKIDALRDR